MSAPSRNALLKGLRPEEVESYLLSHDWHRKGLYGSNATIWVSKSRNSPQLLVPTKYELKDYEARVLEVVSTISKIEERTFDEVLAEMHRANSDLIKIRVSHPDVENGSILLNDGVRMIESARELLRAAVQATFKKKKSFKGKFAGPVSTYLDDARLGQTEHGSYVVNLIAPVQIRDSEQSDHSTSSVSRNVSYTLARSLEAITASVTSYIETNKLVEFEKAVSAGASSNLCDALIGLSGTTQSRAVHISIQLGRDEPDLQKRQLTYVFNSNTMPYLKKASSYYKGTYVVNDATVTGLVTKLSHDGGDDVGTIWIHAGINEKRTTVSIVLSEENYWRAVEAHQKSQPIACSGVLSVTPKSARLADSYDFRVLSSLDIISDS